MNKKEVKKMINDVGRRIDRRSPEILAGIGIAGMITTVVLAVRATPKALTLIDEASNEKNAELTRVEVVKAAWKPYIPAAVTGVMSVTCMIGSVHIGARRIAAISTAYKLTETAFSEYKDKVVETIGEKKEKAIKEKIDKDKVEKDPVSKNVVIITEKGNTLCYDVLSGRYFKSDIEKIKKAINEINRQLTFDFYVSLNEFYDELGLPDTKLGGELGWNLDDGLIEPSFSSQIAYDGTPIIVLDYNVAPRYDYFKFGDR